MPAVNFVPVVIGGKSYDLAFKFNAISEAEKLTGLNLLGGMKAAIVGDMSASQFRALLYAALQKAHGPTRDDKGKLIPGITLEEAGNLLEIAMAEGAAGGIHEALLTSYGVSFEKTVPPEADPQAENSGASVT